MELSADLVKRVRAEYGEMPGLRLTVAQACRLWQLDEATGEAVMKQLMDDGVIRRMADGAYVSMRSSQLTVALGGRRSRRTA